MGFRSVVRRRWFCVFCECYLLCPVCGTFDLLAFTLILFFSKGIFGEEDGERRGELEEIETFLADVAILAKDIRCVMIQRSL